MSSERAAQLIDAGIWLKLSGDIEGARRLFERALKLDPENGRAKDLLAQDATAPVEAPPPPPPENPFERPRASSADWGAATGFEGAGPVGPPAVPAVPDLASDWGRATGAAGSPVPQVAPVVPPSRSESTGPRKTLMLGAAPGPAPSRATFPQYGRTPAPASAPQQSSPSGTRTPVQFGGPQERGAAPTRSSSPSGVRSTVQFGTAPTPPPVAPVVPPRASSGSSAGHEQAPPSRTASPPGVSTAAPSRTSSPAGASDTPPPGAAPRSSAPAEARVTAQLGGGSAAGASPPEPRITVNYGGAGTPPPRSSSPSGARTTGHYGEPATPPAASPRSSSPSGARTTSQYGAPPTPPAVASRTSSPSGARMTADFGAPPTPLRPSMVTFGPAPTPPDATGQVRTTVQYGGAPGAPDPLAGASPSSAPGPRSTLVFSGGTGEPLPPSLEPEVKPVVIRLDVEDTVSDGEDPVVEMLRRQVDGARESRGKPWAPSAPLIEAQPSSADASGTIVLAAREHDPSAQRPPPSMFTVGSPSTLLLDPPRSDTALEALYTSKAPSPPPAQPDGNAWSWSAGTPPEPRDAAVDQPPAPRPSPALTPEASSAWDQRSNPGIKMDDMVAPDRTMELVSSSSKVTRSPEARREETAALLRGARDLMDLDDHTGAMELIEKAQGLAPDDPEVQQLREKSERTLLAMFESKLGHLEKVPRVMLKDDEIIWLNLDHRAGFVLAQIDGTMTFEDLFAVSGMSRLDTSRILAQLVDEGVISRG